MKRVTSRRQLAISTVLVMLSLSASGVQKANYHRPPVDTPADWTRMASGPLAAGSLRQGPGSGLVAGPSTTRN
jgi:hypothetical protein